MGRLSLAIVFVLFAAGCIQPVSTSDLTKTAVGPGAAPVVVPSTVPGSAPGPAVAAQPTSAVGGAPTPGPSSAISQFIVGRGDTPNALQMWYDQPLVGDQLQGFSYTGASGLPCAGFLLLAMVNGVWQPNNGALACTPQPGSNALAAVTFIATSDGQIFTIVFGRVDDPTISAIAVVYNDGTDQRVSPFLGGFLLVRAGVVSANVITAINAEGNTVIPNIPQSPV